MKMNTYEDNHSNGIDEYGVKWSITASSEVDDEEEGGEEYLYVYLHAEHHFKSK